MINIVPIFPTFIVEPDTLFGNNGI